MPKYELTYFPVRGKAEAIRMALTVAGVEFEGVRVAPKEWFGHTRTQSLFTCFGGAKEDWILAKLRRAGCHGKGRSKHIFPSTLPMTPRAP